MVVVDEAHEGTQTNLGKNVIEYLSKEETKVLQLSGTPFNLLEDFDSQKIFNWDYVDEQTAKDKWEEDHPGENNNPYRGLPKIHFCNFDIEKNIAKLPKGAAFSFSEFFRVYPNKDGMNFKVPEGMHGRFVHEEEIIAFLDKMCEKSETSNFPFSTDEYRKAFKHTFWILPGVAAANALEKLLKLHKIFKRFEIVNVAGTPESFDDKDPALDRVHNTIQKGRPTITLSCDRLTTGVTVREWTAVFYLRGSVNTMASAYMQTIFRAQSPWIVGDDPQNPNNEIVKRNCYVFDFAPDRALTMVAHAAKYRTLSNTDRKESLKDVLKQREDEIDNMKQFLSFCSVLSLAEGTSMSGGKYTPEQLYQELKHVAVDRVVNKGFDDLSLYNIKALMDLTPEEIDKLNGIGKKVGDVPTNSGTQKHKDASKVDVNNNGLDGLTNEERKLANKNDKELSEDEKAKKKELLEKKKQFKAERDKRISNLRGIALRIPLIMFGADVEDEDIAITIENFTDIVKDRDWKEFMPKDITPDDFNYFKKCFDPDVFAAAGRKYREMAREADLMNTEERIKCINDIFDLFHNPDKETVLTPWKVVNRHLSDTVGGYCFYDESFEKPCQVQIESKDKLFDFADTLEPRFVNRGEVTKSVFKNIDKTNNKLDSKILEINSKTGKYPLYIAYSLYRSRIQNYIDAGLFKDRRDISVEDQHVIWDDILKENIYIICNTPMAEKITLRTLRGFRDVSNVNIKNDQLVEKAQENAKALAKRICSSSYWSDNNNIEMIKFSAVVGNPPYQLTGGSGGNNDAPIYQHFVNVGKSVDAQYCSMIMPSRWFSAGRENLLGDFRRSMLSCKKLSSMTCYANAQKVFENVEIKGGICYFLYDNKYQGDCNYTLIEGTDTITKSIDLSALNVLIRDPRIQEIVKEVEKRRKELGEGTVDTIISSDTPFGIPSNPKDSKKTPFSVFDNESPEHNTLLFHIEDGNRKIEYVRLNDVTKNTHDVSKFKVFVPGSGGSGNDSIVLGTPEYAPQNSVCSQSYLYAAFETEFEAKAFCKYLKTKFLRLLVSSIKITQSAPNRVYVFVPLLDFSQNSDINWDLPIDQVENALYKKYSIEMYKDFIESKVKPIND